MNLLMPIITFNTPDRLMIKSTAQKLSLNYNKKISPIQVIRDFDKNMIYLENLKDFSLNINDNSFDNQRLKKVLLQICQLNNLQRMVLDISNNTISNEGLEQIGIVSQTIQTLHSLVLKVQSNNKINGRGFVDLSNRLIDSHITTLELQTDSNILDSKFAQFCLQLRKNPHFSSLKLSCSSQLKLTQIPSIIKGFQNIPIVKLQMRDLTILKEGDNLFTFDVKPSLKHSLEVSSERLVVTHKIIEAFQNDICALAFDINDAKNFDFKHYSYLFKELPRLRVFNIQGDFSEYFYYSLKLRKNNKTSIDLSLKSWYYPCNNFEKDLNHLIENFPKLIYLTIDVESTQTVDTLKPVLSILSSKLKDIKYVSIRNIDNEAIKSKIIALSYPFKRKQKSLVVFQCLPLQIVNIQ